MDPLEERLRALRLQSSASRPNIASPSYHRFAGPIPTQTDLKPPHSHDEIINNILLEQECPSEITIFPEFAHFELPSRHVKMSMTDDELKGGCGITIKRRDPNEVCYLGRYIIPMLTYGFTDKGASMLISLAYNLMKPGCKFTKYVFNGAEELESVGDKLVDDFSDYPLSSGHIYEYHVIPAPNCSEVVEAAYYAYIATSTLRLFSKPPINYVKAWYHILNEFEKLYKVRVDISVPVPSVDAVTGLANWYDSDPTVKQTLYRFLYMGGVKDDADGLKEFLYGIHLNFTGMHLAPMFLELCSILNCEHDIILRQLDAPQGKREMDCLIAFLKMHMSNGEEYKRGIYKCGRIFDHSFLVDIQTKSCPKIVYLFGLMLKSLLPQRYEYILNITHLRGLSEEQKQRCAIVSDLKCENEGSGRLAGVMDRFQKFLEVLSF